MDIYKNIPPDSPYNWIPVYRAIAEKVLEYRNNQGFLLDIIQETIDQKIVESRADYKAIIDEKSKKIILPGIDGFSFLSFFNRFFLKENRKNIIRLLCSRLNINFNDKIEFNGLPTRNKTLLYFKPFEKNHKNEDIKNLWLLFEQTLKTSIDEATFNYFYNINKNNITYGLFLINPANYLYLDSKNINYLKKIDAIDETNYNLWKNYKLNYKLYSSILEKVRKTIPGKPFWEISYEAYLENEKEKTIKNLEEQRNVWWLNAKPGQTKIQQLKVGDVENYYTYNEENGEKRKIFKYFNEMKEGDLIIGYSTSPDTFIDCLCEVTEIHKENDEVKNFFYKKIEKFDNPVTFKELKDNKELSNCEPLKNNQGSIFKVKPDEYEIIRGMIEQKNNLHNKSNSNTEAKTTNYTIDDAIQDLFIDKKDFEKIISIIKRKKNLILQGPPGVGKTFFAKKIAYCLIGKKDDSKIDMVQFHQSYSYEDFIQGIRPDENGNFKIVNGIFYKFCKKAIEDSKNKYVFIIDEINRGNLSKIFGELLMLIENDKRGKDYELSLTYSSNSDDKFYIPENLFIIGTMNTADRSLAIVDYALRRRFAFYPLNPQFKHSNFKKELEKSKIDNDLINQIIERLNEINEKIKKDENLGEGFQIGHSYFCNLNQDNIEQQIEIIIESEIVPLLEEYYFDDANKVKEYRNILKQIISNNGQ